MCVLLLCEDFQEQKVYELLWFPLPVSNHHVSSSTEMVLFYYSQFILFKLFFPPCLSLSPFSDIPPATDTYT